MNWLELLSKIFEVCVIPLLGVLTTYIVSFLKAQREKVLTTTSNELINKYTAIAFDVISNCVIATNQTYVDSLKKKGQFDAAAQKEAFNITFNTVKSLLSSEAISVLNEVYGDIDIYITKQIESLVNQNKITIEENK